MSDKVLNAKKIVVEYNFSCGLPLPYKDGYECHGEFGKFFGDSFRSILGELDSRGAQKLISILKLGQENTFYDCGRIDPQFVLMVVYLKLELGIDYFKKYPEIF